MRYVFVCPLPFVQVNFSKGHTAVVDSNAIKEGLMKVSAAAAVCDWLSGSLRERVRIVSFLQALESSVCVCVRSHCI